MRWKRDKRYGHTCDYCGYVGIMSARLDHGGKKTYACYKQKCINYIHYEHDLLSVYY